jgi:glycopeptide antibiotics resistance protein
METTAILPPAAPTVANRVEAKAAAHTGPRLARAVLAYYVAVVAVIVLMPFHFAAPERFEWVWIFDTQDFVANVVMFVPFGFLFRFARRGGSSGVAGAFLAGAAASCVVEVIQMWAPHRIASPFVSHGSGGWKSAIDGR